MVEASEGNDTTGQVLAVGVAVGYVERPLLRQVQPGKRKKTADGSSHTDAETAYSTARQGRLG